jgi:16S rRNA U516 pseudouridylate synthase RsuA-like enzyme
VEPLYDTGSSSGSSSSGNSNTAVLKMTLTEGRNRQIRVMLDTVGGYAVMRLHRTEFMGLTLSRLLEPGDWTRLDDQELQLLQDAMNTSTATTTTTTTAPLSVEMKNHVQES